MYNAVDVSRYIINYSNEKDYCITNLKLQKLLYFVQIQFLFEKDIPCFIEKIEAWDFGVVVPESYSEFSIFGLSNIPTIKSYLIFTSNRLWDVERIEFNDSIISSEDKKLINEVVDELSKYSAVDLMEVSSHQAPYLNIYARGKKNEITLEALREYFCK